MSRPARVQVDVRGKSQRVTREGHVVILAEVDRVHEFGCVCDGVDRAGEFVAGAIHDRNGDRVKVVESSRGNGCVNHRLKPCGNLHFKSGRVSERVCDVERTVVVDVFCAADEVFVKPIFVVDHAFPVFAFVRHLFEKDEVITHLGAISLVTVAVAVTLPLVASNRGGRSISHTGKDDLRCVKGRLVVDVCNEFRHVSTGRGGRQREGDVGRTRSCMVHGTDKHQVVQRDVVTCGRVALNTVVADEAADFLSRPAGNHEIQIQIDVLQRNAVAGNVSCDTAGVAIAAGELRNQSGVADDEVLDGSAMAEILGNETDFVAGAAEVRKAVKAFENVALTVERAAEGGQRRPCVGSSGREVHGTGFAVPFDFALCAPGRVDVHVGRDLEDVAAAVSRVGVDLRDKGVVLVKAVDEVAGAALVVVAVCVAGDRLIGHDVNVLVRDDGARRVGADGAHLAGPAGGCRGVVGLEGHRAGAAHVAVAVVGEVVDVIGACGA